MSERQPVKAVSHEEIMQRVESVEREMRRGSERFASIDRHLEQGRTDRVALKQTVDAVDDRTKCIPEMQKDLGHVREILEALQGLRTLGKLLTGIAKPILMIAGVVASGWGLFKLAVITATKGG